MVGLPEIRIRQTFEGGQQDADLGLSGDFLPTNETFMRRNTALKLKNVYVDNNGILRKRPGTTRINTVSTSEEIIGIFDFTDSGGVVFTVVASKTKLWYATLGAGFVEITWNGGAFSDVIFDCAVYDDVIILAHSGAQTPQKWDGSIAGPATADLGGAPPKAKYVEHYKNFVFLAGNTTNESRLSPSALGDPDSWTATDEIDVDASDGDLITGLKTFQDSLVIFKRFSIHVLNGSTIDTFQVRRVVDGIGCFAHSSITEINGELWFYSESGPMIFNGATVRYCSPTNKLRRTLSTSIMGGVVNIDRVDRVGAVYDPLRGLFLMVVATDDSYNNRLYCYNIRRDAWSYWEERNAVDMFISIARIYDTTISATVTDNQPVIWLGQSGYASRLNPETSLADTDDDLDTDTEPVVEIEMANIRPSEDEAVFDRTEFHVEQYTEQQVSTDIDVLRYVDWNTVALATVTVNLSVAVATATARKTAVMRLDAITAKQLKLEAQYDDKGPFDLAAIDVIARPLQRNFVG